VFALLPGSRMSEVRHNGEVMLEAAAIVAERLTDARFVVPCVRPEIAEWLASACKPRQLPIVAYEGDARQALTACDAALVKSGTSTLETLLIGRPMVITYRMGRFSSLVVRALLRTPFVGLPNILAGRALVPELLQDEATPAALAAALLGELDKAGRDPEYLRTFTAMHRELRRNADQRAAEAVAALLGPQTGG
jgi:lipid-A-disaccharide synthase